MFGTVVIAFFVFASSAMSNDSDDGFSPVAHELLLDSSSELAGVSAVGHCLADDAEDEERRVLELITGSQAGLAPNAVSSLITHDDAIPASCQGAVAFSRLVADAASRLPPPGIVMPWERGLASRIFTNAVWMPSVDRNVSVFIRPEPWRFSNANSEVAAVAEDHLRQKVRATAAFPLAVRRLKDLDLRVTSDASRNRALVRWKVLMQLSPESSGVGRTLLQEMSKLATDFAIVQTLDDMLAKKAASTMSKRAGDIIKYVQFCAKRGKPPFPFEEKLCYEYCNDLITTGKAFPTSLSSFRSAVAFAYHVFQFDGGLTVLQSKRIEGAAFKLLSTKAVLHQMQPFTQLEIISLEFTACFCPILQDRIFCGHVLFCIYSRSRWGDHQGIEELIWDYFDSDASGFVQGNTRHAKTSVTAAQRTRFLPLTAPLRHLGPHKWWVYWRQARSDAGLEEGVDKPFLPAPSHYGGWCQRALTAGEAGAWLREVLRAAGFDGVDKASHSAKATLLSWCAKAGVDPPTRLTLGYHVGASSNTLLHYSRDALSGPLRTLNKVINAVISKRFDPDVSRSGYFPSLDSSRVSKKPKLDADARDNVTGGVSNSSAVASTVEASIPSVVTCCLPTCCTIVPLGLGFSDAVSGLHVACSSEHLQIWKLQGKQSRVTLQANVSEDDSEHNASEHDSSDSEDSSESSDIDDAFIQVVANDDAPADLSAKARAPAKSAGEGTFVHKRTGTLHKAHVVDGLLACGRDCTDAYKPAENSTFNWSKCSTCFGST